MAKTYNAFFEGNLYNKTFTEWEYVTGISSQILRRRAKNPKTTPYNFLEPINGGERMISAYGEILSSREWAERTGIPSRTINRRLSLGWDPERAVSEPLHGRIVPNRKTGIKPYLKLTYNGREYTIGELSEMSGLSERVIRERIRKLHWDVEKAVDTPRRQVSTAETRKKRREKVVNTIENKIYIEIQGEKKTVKEWSAISGVPEKTIYTRLKSLKNGRCKGWNSKQIVYTPPRKAKR